jgi:AcrR family transcriptional regulator
MMKPAGSGGDDGGGAPERPGAARGARAVKPRGPRSDGGQAREQIVAAARRQFGTHGYDGATMRGIAADAGVDVALVAYYFGSKSGVFIAALSLPVNPADVIDGLLAGPRDDLGERLVRRLLTVWDDPTASAPLVGVLRSVSSQGELLREFIEHVILVRLARGIGAPDAELRAAAAATQVLGLVTARYVLRVEPLASAGHDELVALIGPTMQRYLVPE